MKAGAGCTFHSPHLSNLGHCEIGDDCTIHSHVWIGDGVIIGHRCKIQAFAFIPPGVLIDSDVFIGPHVCFTNDRKPPSTSDEWEKTLVERGASIGAGAVILPGCHIGEGARIGAGAVVVCAVSAGVTVVGNPARPVGHGINPAAPAELRVGHATEREALRNE